MTLAHFRRKIDQFDRRPVALLNRRARAAERIGQLKRKTRMAIYEPRRESMILDNVRRANRGPLSHRQLAEIYRRIIRAMRALQRDIILSDSTPRKKLKKIG